jgi:hypothetical protein
MSSTTISAPADGPPWKLVGGRFASVAGDQIVELTVLWTVWAATGSSTWTAIAIFCGRAPLWIFALLGSGFVQRHGPLATIARLNFCAVGVAAAAAFVAGWSVIAAIASFFAIASLRAVEAAALAAAVPERVSPGGAQKFNALLDNAKRVGRLAGPLGTRLLEATAPWVAMTTAGALYGVMGWAAVRSEGRGARNVVRSGSSASIVESLRRFGRDRAVRVLVGGAAAYAFFWSACWYAVLPRLCFDAPDGSASALATVVAAAALGGILTNFALARFPVDRAERAVALAVLVAGIGYGLLAVEPGALPRLAIAVVVGAAAASVQDVFIVCVLQRWAAVGQVARLHAIWRLACELAISLGLLVGGVAVDHRGAPPVAAVCGVTIVAIGLYLFAALRNPVSASPTEPERSPEEGAENDSRTR